MLNVCIFQGRLTREPELEYVGPSQTPKLSFSIAVAERRKKGEEYEEVAHFLDLVAWASGAEAIANYFTKGDLITVHCKAEFNSWETEGQKRSRVTFRVNRFEFPPFNSPRDKEKSSNPNNKGSNKNVSGTSRDEGGFDEGDESIPF